ncbi:conserved hypothetical protein [Histoplasma capsulatum H143]|uniref:Galactose oxidase n=1 Tax=Ajellomyces capsulatus (strain H143) TaxID=544712 RepID=C6H8C0_AJECH|nr:conserved hypothetical protein [Histoplasma capsulatum H143]
MRKTTSFGLAVGVLAMLAGRVPAELPYNPSYISNPVSPNQTEVFILSPQNSASSNRFRLQSLDISTSFAVSQLPISENFVNMPFVTDDGSNSFISTTDAAGTLTVYAGDCHTNSSTVWRLLRTYGDSSNNLKWQELPVLSAGGEHVRGPSYLSAAVSYPSPVPPSLPGLFVFGGMCPWVDKKDNSWVSAADYSKSIMSLTADKASSIPSYQAEIITPGSSPVAEAGFAITPLGPAYSNSSSGKTLQHQNFVLTGGHTQGAFINMSQVALFSLPEATWSYVLVSQDSATSSLPDLEGIDGVEPRSGHTALLSPDASKIIVFGGWVGDISRPAQPQLVILELGAAYGGSGHWKWTVPRQTMHGPKPGTGIFGHGAAMLPGGIMFVTGGYSIPQSAPKQSRTGLTANTKGYLFNTTSETWITSYIPTNNMGPYRQANHGPLSRNSQKAGLGLGVGIGLVIVTVIAFLVYRRRSRHSREQRRTREQVLRRLALGAERPHLDPSGNVHQPTNNVTAEKLALYPNAYSWVGNPSNRDSKDTGTTSAERTGLLVDMPSPTRGLRRSVHYRGCQSSPCFESSRRNVGFSGIHPIDEGDECEDAIDNSAMAVEKGATQQQSRTSVISNPFSDSSRYSDSYSASSFPQGIAIHEKSSSNEWTDTSESNDTASRSYSPDKSLRTLSGFSEVSSSFMSSSSQPANRVFLNKNLADGPAAFEPIQHWSPESHFQGQLHAHSTGSGSSYDPVNELSTHTTWSSDNTVVSQGPALNATFGRSQAENEFLLGVTPLESSRRGLNVMQNKGRGLVGNVRRTLRSVRRAENIAKSNSVSLENMSSGSQRSQRPEQQQQQYEPYKPYQQQRSTSTSPTKSLYSFQDGRESTTTSDSHSIPGRAMSSASSILGRKQGAKDWGAKRSSADSAQIRLLQAARAADANNLDGAASSTESGAGMSLSSHSPDLLDYDDDEEWDVEAAAEGRLVQIAYTVPKEKLRVVNPGVGDYVDER